MKKVAFRFTAIAGAQIKTSWRDIDHLSGQTVGEGDVIEYAYAAPVVTEEMVDRLAKHMCREEWKDRCRTLEDLAEHIKYAGRYKDEARAALIAVLEPDNAD